MTHKTRTAVLAIAFIVLCFAVLAFGLIATRFTQGTSQAGDGVLLLVFALIAVAALIAIHMAY